MARGSSVGYAAQAKEGATKGPTPVYYGVSACNECHTKPTTTNIVLCRCTESEIWMKEDKHKQAYDVLKSPRGKRMGQLLGYKVEEDKRCVSCHGVYIQDPKLREESVQLDFKLEDGVSCVACHGAYREWANLHGLPLERAKWRSYSRQVKEEQFGMIDLWDPAKRTRMCASCHVGSPAEGKVVTHDMYAAGHPPLPSFEVATFSDEMPRHWEYIKEKKEAAQKLLHFEPADAQWERTKLVLVSGVAEFREAMNLVAQDADMAGKATEPDRQVLDLARFDCYACHHDLKSPSWRQERGYAGKPGRPQMQPWPNVLVKLALVHVGREKAEFDTELKKVQQAFDARPFGDPKAIAAAAQAMVQWSDKLIAETEKSHLDAAAATRLLRELAAMGSKELLDYDSARQVAWAFKTIYSELKGKFPDSQDAKFREHLDALDKELKLHLPSGQKENIVQQLPTALNVMNNYEAKDFQRHMAELAKLLPKE
jgi:hypothetical protein